jgi:hypothetical protein
MREIRTSGSMRGEWVGSNQPSPSLLLYRNLCVLCVTAPLLGLQTKPEVASEEAPPVTSLIPLIPNNFASNRAFRTSTSAISWA